MGDQSGLNPNVNDDDGLRDDEEVGFHNDYENYNPLEPVLNPTGTDTDGVRAD